MAEQGFTNVQQAPGSGGVCRHHGVYEGGGCVKCARTKALAALRAAATIFAALRLWKANAAWCAK